MNKTMMRVRPPAIADMFYPGDPERLSSMIDSMMRGKMIPSTTPVAIIAPHAGLVYSGPVAASAYSFLLSGPLISRVVLVGPSHRTLFDGLALSSMDGFETPLGQVPIDREAVKELLKQPHCHINDQAHEHEHCLEVQLPFLQKLINDFSIIPVLTGKISSEQLAEAMEPFLDAPDTLIVISSDLSHYQTYDEAVRHDSTTARNIERLLEDNIKHDDACGRTSIKGMIKLARRKDLHVASLDLRNSGDTAGSRDQVVGYGAFHFYKN